MKLAWCYFVLWSYLRYTCLVVIPSTGWTMSAARKAKVTPPKQNIPRDDVVTRAEEWWIEAESLEEAEALLVAGGPSGVTWRAYHAELDVVLTDEKS